MSDHNRRQDLAEGDILLSLFAPKVLEKAAFPAGVQVPAPVATPPVAQPSWVQRHQGPLALGGIGLAGALGGGALAYYKNQQEKKKKRKLLGQQEEQQTPAPKEAGVKQANNPLPEFKLDDTSSWKMGDRIGNVVSQPLNYVGKQIGAGASETANPFTGFGNYVKSNPWASMALVGAPIGAGIGLLGGLANRKKKRDALGDMLTGGMLGAGAGALGGGALQMFQNKAPAAPEAPPGPKDVAGVTNSPAYGGNGSTQDVTNKAKEFFGGSNDSARQVKNLEGANSLYSLAARSDPNSPTFKGFDQAANNRLSAQQAVVGAEEGAPRLIDRLGLSGLGIGKQVDPNYAQKIEAARAGSAQSNADLGLAARKIPPQAFMSGPGADQIGAPFSGFGPAPALAARAGGGLGTFQMLDKGLQEKGLSPWPKKTLGWNEGIADAASGRKGPLYAGADKLPENLVADPNTFDAFNSDQIVKDVPFGAKGSLGANTVQNAAGIGAGRWAMTQLNRLRTGNTQNQADAARWAQGLMKSLKTPAAPAVKPGEGRSLLNPRLWTNGAADLAGRAGRALGLSTKPISAEQFAANPGATAALAATHATGRLGSTPMTAEQVIKDITSGKPSPGTRAALQDLGKGFRTVNGEKIPVGRREVDLNQMPKLTDEQKKTLGGTDGVFGKGTTVKEQLAPKAPDVAQAPPKPETAASKVTGDVKPVAPAAQTRGDAIVSTKAPPKAAPQQPPTQLPASPPSPTARIGDEDTSHFSGPRPATPPAEKATGPTSVRPQPAIVGRNNRDGSPIYATVPQVQATATPPDFSRVRGNTVYGADIGVGGKMVQEPPKPLITAPSTITGGTSSSTAPDTTVSRPAPKTETPKVRDLPVTQAAPQTAAKKPDAPKPQAKVTLPAVTGTGGRIGGQLRATGQNLAMGGLAAGLDKAVRGGADARSMGATAFGRENDPTDPANIRKLYEKVIRGSGAATTTGQKKDEE
jgi:hypothetical protein